MKNFLMVLILIGFNVSFANELQFAKIQERGTEKEIILYKTESSMLFYSVDGEDRKLLKEVSIEREADNIVISGDSNKYSFKVFKRMKKASGKFYKWCWTEEIYHDTYTRDTPATFGLNILIVGVIPTMALCAAVPAAPFLLGVALTPIDAIITGSDHLFDKENIALRKFQQLLKGKSSKTSPEVFEILERKIAEI